ncbi:pilus assembly protein TadG-related protein [Promicromonospora sp. CA-289599]|uniref:pilus assembly protein TadG-related protein n=1 Tax=Promicromonospora sp. CA-289599 TaxID=3240014 RepID=UPI003D8C3610
MTIPITVGMLSAAVLVITMVGSATSDRREVGTAADAAALAAAQEWDEHLGVLNALHLGVPGLAAFWGILDEPALTDDARAEIYAAAEEYAERNGGELTELRIDPSLLQVTAEVRNKDEVPVAGVRSEASATAQVRLTGGLCLGDDGLGWRVDGECVTDEPDVEDVAPDDGDVPDDRGEMSQFLAAKYAKEFPDKNIVVVHEDIAVSFGPDVRGLVRLATEGDFDVFGLDQGTVTRHGDGGYINWAFYGSFERDDNVVRFEPRRDEDVELPELAEFSSEIILID